MSKTVWVIVILVLIIVVAYLVWGGETTTPSPTLNEASEYQILVSDQTPDESVVIDSVGFTESGFVVIHEDNNGQPGAVIGVGGPLIGAIGGLGISLDRVSVEGETLYAQIHSDNGDGVFNADDDQPAYNEEGDPIIESFDISF